MTRYTEEGYKWGMCDVFAVAARRYLEKPIYIVRGAYKNKRHDPEREGDEPEFLFENCHAVVKVGEDKYFDVDGIKDGETLEDNCYFENVILWKEIVPFEGDESLSSLFKCVGVNESDVLDAMDLVREVWEMGSRKKCDTSARFG